MQLIEDRAVWGGAEGCRLVSPRTASTRCWVFPELTTRGVRLPVLDPDSSLSPRHVKTEAGHGVYAPRREPHSLHVLGGPLSSALGYSELCPSDPEGPVGLDRAPGANSCPDSPALLNGEHSCVPSHPPLYYPRSGIFPHGPLANPGELIIP